MSDLAYVPLCTFISHASVYSGQECGEEATHIYEGNLYCRAHWVYESRAYGICSKCHNARYSDVAIFEREHICSTIDAGGDCMHYEYANYCTCEADAKVVVCIVCEDVKVPYVDEICQSCAAERADEDRWYHEVYNSQ